MKRQVSKQTAEMRAEMWFELYYALGPDRSLTQLHKHGSALGLDMPSWTTLKRWSNERRWKELIVEREERLRPAREEATASEIETMNRRQATLGSALQQLGARIVDSRLQDAALLRESSVAEAARVIDVGAKLERLARGAVTDRQEIVVSVWTTVVNEISAIFLQTNTIEDPERRKREFALQVDDLIDKHAPLMMVAEK